MKVTQLEKPTVEKHTGISKEFARLMKEIDMPIYNWCKEQEEKRKNIKL